MLAVAGALSLAPILAVVALQVANAATPAASTQPGSLLRLNDLQIGYVGFPPQCEPLQEVEGSAPELTEFIDHFKPKGCLAGYIRLFPVKNQEPDPPIVASVVLEARSGDEADAALAVLPQLIARINDDQAATEVVPAETIGDLTRLFHLGNVENGVSDRDLASALVWRSGNVLAGVLALGGQPAANDRNVAILARRQQAHIETRTPYTGAERDDTEAALDDPGLPVDVHWLGRHFEPGHGVRSSRLAFAASGKGAKSRRGAAVELDYGGGLSIESWTRGAWQRHRRGQVGSLVRDWDCTRTSTVRVRDGGLATIYAGYRQDFASCPKRPPSVFFADVQYGRTVLSVDGPTCVRCGTLSKSAYDSPQGLRAVVRGLRLRTPATPR